MTRFSLSFVEAGGEDGLAIIIGGDLLVGGAAGLLKTATKAAFADTFTVAGVSGNIADAAIADLSTRIDQIVAAVNAPTAGAIDDATTFFELADSIIADAITLVQAPADLASDIGDMIDAIGDLEALKALSANRRASQTFGATPPEDPGEAQLLTNQDAFTRLIQRAALAESATAAVDFPYEIFDDAIADRDLIAERIEAEELLTNSLEEFDGLVDTRTELVDAITNAADSLVRLRDMTVTVVTTTLQMAWDLYGDASRAEEIADRNQIAHPLFVPPGVYTVLSE
jgi:prophage DNA circulation protein